MNVEQVMQYVFDELEEPVCIHFLLEKVYKNKVTNQFLFLPVDFKFVQELQKRAIKAKKLT